MCVYVKQSKMIIERYKQATIEWDTNSICFKWYNTSNENVVTILMDLQRELFVHFLKISLDFFSESLNPAYGKMF